ncbi:MAG: PaREP1 family protein [Desulfurococcus sp.]|nr:PaREP1 family protein [Desulfurococcus sp.]
MSSTITLPEILVEEIAKRASRAGLSVEEYLADLVFGSMDPDEAAGKYIETALHLVEQAREELSRGDLRQASEKIWGACALAIKAHALARRKRRLESHAELWVYKNEVAVEIGSWVRIVFKIADSMHRNFYEGLATREDVEDAIEEVEKLVKAIAEKLK